MGWLASANWIWHINERMRESHKKKLRLTADSTLNKAQQCVRWCFYFSSTECHIPTSYLRRRPFCDAYSIKLRFQSKRNDSHFMDVFEVIVQYLDIRTSHFLNLFINSVPFFIFFHYAIRDTERVQNCNWKEFYSNIEI